MVSPPTPPPQRRLWKENKTLGVVGGVKNKREGCCSLDLFHIALRIPFHLLSVQIIWDWLFSFSMSCSKPITELQGIRGRREALEPPAEAGGSLAQLSSAICFQKGGRARTCLSFGCFSS